MTFLLNKAYSPLGPSRLVTPAARSHIRVNRAKGVMFFTGGFQHGRCT